MKGITKDLGFAVLCVRMERIGEDILVTVRGGEAHIGTCVLAVPRTSLADPGKPGCTSSVMNVTGHKDELICRELAESVCLKTGRTVVCTGGFHLDDLEPERIRAVTEAVREISESCIINMNR